MLGFGGLTLAPEVANAAPAGTVINVAITDHGMYVDGPTTFPAGRVHLSIDASGKGRCAAIGLLHSGYSFQDLRDDIRTLGENLFGPNGSKKKGLKAEAHFIANTTAVGGLCADDGQARHGTVMVKQVGGNYVLFDDSGNIPKRPTFLTVTSPSGPQQLAPVEGRVIAKTNRRFDGKRVLPADGDIRFVNQSTESPHFVEFQHVKNGTTRKDVINGLQSDGRPDFVLEGTQDVDLLSSNQRMNVHLHLPPGAYAVMCFFPDPKTGDPHAFMGMVRMVHLR
jgi:hypothetical protein